MKFTPREFHDLYTFDKKASNWRLFIIYSLFTVASIDR